MRDLQQARDDRHEPREAFIAELEHRVREEVQRVGAPARGPRQWSRGVLALAACLIAAVSAAMGGGAVALAYQAQRADLRDRLVATYEQRVALEEQRLLAARAVLKERENRSAIGIETPDSLREARATVTSAEAAVALVALELAEVRLTSQEPVAAASAPLVAGRDFVSERWQVELTVPNGALDLERQRLRFAQVRFDNGLANANDVEAAGLRVIEIEAAVVALQQKLRIRQQFLKGLIGAALADLRVLEAEAEQRRTTVERRIELATRQLKDMELRVEIGTLAPIDVSGARLRLQELQLELTRATYDLELIRERIRRHKV